ncbi:MAG TPA: hypothetical protein VF505_08700, partial [Thermoanaerobaculia bacterium]
MLSRDLGAIIVPLHESMHSAFRWLARGAKLTKGYAVKVAGRDPVLVAYPMERDEAAAVFTLAQQGANAVDDLFGSLTHGTDVINLALVL